MAPVDSSAVHRVSIRVRVSSSPSLRPALRARPPHGAARDRSTAADAAESAMPSTDFVFSRAAREEAHPGAIAFVRGFLMDGVPAAPLRFVRAVGKQSGVARGSTMKPRKFLMTVALLAVAASTASAQVIDPHYAGTHSLADLGSVPGVPADFGGLTFHPGDPNTLLLGGGANTPDGAVYAVPLVRDGKDRVSGFGAPGRFALAPHIDGGLDFGPGGVLFYTGYNTHVVGQIRPGSTVPDKVISLAGSGIDASTGTLRFVPEGFPGAGRLKITSFDASTWHDAEVISDGQGTYDIGNVGPAILLPRGPEGIAYVHGANALFGVDSVLVTEFGRGRVRAYEIDGNGDPIIATRRLFLSGLPRVVGAAVDPVTGDVLFSTFGAGNRIVRVGGFVIPEPAAAALGVPFVAAYLGLRRRTRGGRGGG